MNIFTNIISKNATVVNRKAFLYVNYAAVTDRNA